MDMKNGSQSNRAAGSDNLGLVMDVKLDVSLSFGRRALPLGEVLELVPGTVVQLDQSIDDPVELLVGGNLVGRGEVVTADGRYALRLIEVIDPHRQQGVWQA